MPPPENQDAQQQPGPEPRGWFKAFRTEVAGELMRRNPFAFLLAYVIAFRARWQPGFNRHDLAPGEAMLGDYRTYGMTEQQYRTAKTQLEKWGFATFKSTNRGTVGKLTDTRLFWISEPAHNGQGHEQLTGSQRTGNEQLTSNNKGIEGEKGKEGEGLSPGERVSCEKELQRVEAALDRLPRENLNDNEREERRRLRTRREELKAKLGWIV